MFARYNYAHKSFWSSSHKLSDDWITLWLANFPFLKIHEKLPKFTLYSFVGVAFLPPYPFKELSQKQLWQYYALVLSSCSEAGKKAKVCECLKGHKVKKELASFLSFSSEELLHTSSLGKHFSQPLFCFINQNSPQQKRKQGYWNQIPTN